MVALKVAAALMWESMVFYKGSKAPNIGRNDSIAGLFWHTVANLIDRGIEGTSSSLSKMDISKLPSTLCLVHEARGTVEVSKVQGPADQAMVDGGVMFGTRTVLAMMVLIWLSTWADEGKKLRLSLPDWLLFVPEAIGILSC